MGYLKEAVLNYIALLGWSPGGEREIFNVEELVEVFNEKNINKSPSIFDMNKLRFLNGEYIRKMTPEAFEEAIKPYVDPVVKSSTADRTLLANVLQLRCEALGDIPAQVDFIDEMPDYDVEMYTHKKMKTDPETAKVALEAMLPVLENLELFDKDTIHEALFALIEKMEVKNGYILWPLRVAVSGKEFTPGGGVELAAILGKEETIKRVKIALEKLA